MLGGSVDLRPDLFVRIAAGDLELRWFIEVDRGTEHLPAVMRKSTAYDRYYRGGVEQEKHGVFPRVMLARMPAGGVIHPHIDANPAAKWPHKIHVPILTSPAVVSFFGGEEHRFPEGEAVEVNNLGPHWVRNGGDTARVHLIFEYYDADQPEPDWLEPFLLAGAAR